MNIAILYLNTGWGHKSNARALETWILKHYPHAQVTLFNPLKHKSFAKLIIEWGYKLASEYDYAQYLYRMVYDAHAVPSVNRGTDKLLTLTLRNVIDAFFQWWDYTHIISTHFLLQKPILHTIKHNKLHDIAQMKSFVTVVTDPLSPHPIWFHDTWYPYIVFSEQARQIGLQHWVSDEDCHVFQTIINSQFDSILDSSIIDHHRTMYGIWPDDRCILIVGGGEWIPNGGQLIQEIISHHNQSLPYKYIVVCGKHEKLHKELISIVEKAQRESDFIILGFTHEIHQWMSVCDLIVTKGWPATIFEAISLSKPLLIYNQTGPQETGNIKFVTHKWIGLYEDDYALIPALIHEMTSDTDRYQQFVDNISKLWYHNGLDEVVEFIEQSF